MTTLSPLIAEIKPPFKGMDSRSVKPIDSPSLLLNVDLSDRGSLKERPGSKKFADISASIVGGNNPHSVRGLYAYVYDDQLFLLTITIDLINQDMFLVVYNESGIVRSIYQLTEFGAFLGDPPSYDLEPYYKSMGKFAYTFAGAGRFVYFSNGHSNFYRLEIKDQVASNGSWLSPNQENFSLTSNNFTIGNKELVSSYILTGLAPRSLSYFYNQLIATGYRKSTSCALSIPVPEGEDKHTDVPPEQLLNTLRTEMGIDPGSITVSEPFLWDSYPVNDAGGFYWSFDENIIAAVGVGTSIYVFCENNVFKIVGHGSERPQRVRVAEVTLANPKSYCYFKDYLFFVGLDGCYLADPNSIKKVSFEMDGLWFGRSKPQITRYTNSRIKNNGYPYFVDRENLDYANCVNDKSRQQVMVALPNLGAYSNTMVWVFNYGDMLEGIGPGKWSIWTSDDQSEFTATSLGPGTYPGSGGSRPASPTTSEANTSYNIYNWAATTEVTHRGKQRIFFANTPESQYTLGSLSRRNKAIIYEFGVARQDMPDEYAYDRGGVRSGLETIIHYPLVVSLGRVGRVDSDGRIICTDVAVRRKQLSKNVEEEPNAASVTAIVRSEGEGLKHFDATETDIEFPDSILNAQAGVSEATTSTINTLTLGEKPTGTSSPLMSSEYFDSYARVNTPDEEGRSAYVDIYSKATDQPLRVDISEIRVYGSMKGGSQREQS
jgi:hypothetical protein